MMKIMTRAVTLTVIWSAAAAVTQGQIREQEIVENSNTAFEQIMSLHIKAIPQVLLANAEGVAIIPNVIKGGLIVGARHGKGVLLIRDDQGLWDLPVFVSLTGGNVGWQVGVQSTDLVLVFKTRRSVTGILNGKLTLGVDAAAAAGPVGRKAAAATDGRLQAEIYSYSRSRGLFAGVSVDGSVLRIEPHLNEAYYGNVASADGYYVPKSAVQLANKVASYCSPAVVREPLDDFTPESDTFEVLPLPQMQSLGNADAIRSQLAHAASNLSEVLDPQWVNYLSIPSEVFQDGPHPSLKSIRESKRRLDVVVEDSRYSVLTKHEQFERTYSLLREYEWCLTPRETALQIPPPPVIPETDATSLR